MQIEQSHWNTPSSTAVDALGRTIKQVERNGADPDTEWYVVRQAYDIRGNLIKIWDQLGRLAFEHVYDLANREIRTQQLDAGGRRLALDAAGNIVEQRDSKDALVLHSYDELMRPTHLWARNRQNENITLREYVIYGDSPETATGLPKEDAIGKNLLGQLYKHYDETGLVQFDIYDFKGNNVEKKRKVVSDEVILSAFAAAPGNNWEINAYRVDWQPQAGDGIDAHAETILGEEPVEYDTSQQFDALNRVKWVKYPEDIEGNRKLLQPKYNRTGVIEQILFDGRTFVEHIAYNAKGQRTLIAYGNRDPGEPGPRVMTRYAYDPKTFRLARMRTEKFDSPDELHFTPTGAALQDLCYRYDLAGNIRHIVDVTPGCGVQNNPDSARAWAWAEAGIISFEPGYFSILLAQGNALVRAFEYDPTYKLQSATGRECKNIPMPRPWSDHQCAGYNSGNHGTANQDNAPNLTATCKETYTYDPAGNMSSLHHQQGVASWTRRFGVGGATPSQWEQSWRTHVSQWAQASDDSFRNAVWTNPPSNQLRHVGDNNPTINDTHFFDNAGNLVRENTACHFEWDHSNRMRAFYVQTAGVEPSKHAHYLYDSSGQRVKKLVRRRGGQYEVTVYIDGLFEYHLSGPAPAFNTLHVLDDDRRIAVVRVGRDPDDATGKLVKFHLGDHLASSAVVIDQEGNWMNREEYTPYGETSFGSFARKRYRFAGKEQDEESGLYYFGARYYVPWLTRWASCDPNTVRLHNNLYIFNNDNPTRYVDRQGLEPSTPEAIDPSSSMQVVETVGEEREENLIWSNHPNYEVNLNSNIECLVKKGDWVTKFLAGMTGSIDREKAIEQVEIKRIGSDVWESFSEEDVDYIEPGDTLRLKESAVQCENEYNALLEAGDQLARANSDLRKAEEKHSNLMKEVSDVCYKMNESKAGGLACQFYLYPGLDEAEHELNEARGIRDQVKQVYETYRKQYWHCRHLSRDS
jgi:RHS repeat-associated protein